MVFLDAIGLWGASKPSQGLGRKFPQYNYMDMVVANYRLLRDHLNVAQVELATGVSMGATQTWVWGVMYSPSGFVKAIMPIGGTTASDGDDPGRPVDVPPRAGCDRERSELARDQRQLLPPAEGKASRTRACSSCGRRCSSPGYTFPVRSATPWKNTAARSVLLGAERRRDRAPGSGACKSEDAVDYWYRNNGGFSYNINKELKRIKARTLVVHVQNDQWLMVENARKAAAAVPGALFATLSDPGAHYGVFRAPNILKDTIGAFIENRFTAEAAGRRRRRQRRRRLRPGNPPDWPSSRRREMMKQRKDTQCARDRDWQRRRGADRCDAGRTRVRAGSARSPSTTKGRAAPRFDRVVARRCNGRHDAARFLFLAHQAEPQWPDRGGRRDSAAGSSAKPANCANMLSFGGALAYVAKIHGPDGHGGNFILKDPDQEGYAVLGVAFARLRAEDHALTARADRAAVRLEPGRRLSLLQPLRRRLHRPARRARHDPARLRGRIGAGQVRERHRSLLRRLRDRHEADQRDGFQEPRRTRRSCPGTRTACAYGGAQWKINPNMMLQGGYHQADNLLDMSWVDLDLVHRFDKDRYIRLDVQYLYEKDNGDKNLGDVLDEQQGRLPRSALVPWFIPYGMIGRNSDGEELRSPLQPRAVVPGAAHRRKRESRREDLDPRLDLRLLDAGRARPRVRRELRRAHGSPCEGQHRPAARRLEGARHRPHLHLRQRVRLGARHTRARALGAGLGRRRPVLRTATIANIDQKQSDVRFDFQWRFVFK